MIFFVEQMYFLNCLLIFSLKVLLVLQTNVNFKCWLWLIILHCYLLKKTISYFLILFSKRLFRKISRNIFLSEHAVADHSLLWNSNNLISVGSWHMSLKGMARPANKKKIKKNLFLLHYTINCLWCLDIWTLRPWLNLLTFPHGGGGGGGDYAWALDMFAVGKD